MKLITKEMAAGLVKGGVEFVKKNSPHILTGTAVVGVVTTAIFSAKGFLKARDIIEEEKKYRVQKLYMDYEKSNLSPETGNEPPMELVDETEKLTIKDIIKLTWKPMLPAIILGASTISCIIGADVINAGRTAALASSCIAAEKALEEYKKKNINLFGEKNHEKILDEKAKDDVENTELPDEDLIVHTGTGNMLILDALNGRYIRGSRDAIDKVANSINYDMFEHPMFSNGYVSQNDFYDDVGIYERVQDGDERGWCNKYPIIIDWRSALKDGEIPVLVMYHKNPPKPKYILERDY